ncbi:28 kDa heat- and acid-stable phosphoprotein-like [Culicoides brevitarsis]|uniref:28 kDa heat- and acid-stable phosphoprotein-like n=1 Tax=Culicoides brevitarsis TaxID=469753 RepID=UPI00307BBE27
MPRGKYVNHKGRNRHFTDVEELEQERKKAEQKKWRKQQGEDDEEESSSEEEEASEKSEESGSEEESESEDDGKAKGPQGVIEIENPNRVQKKAANKVTQISLDSASGSKKPELSRREREELEKQRAQANYQKLHAQGKTEQARADLARLAIIKQHRAEAAARREAEKKEKEKKALEKR